MDVQAFGKLRGVSIVQAAAVKFVAIISAFRSQTPKKIAVEVREQ